MQLKMTTDQALSDITAMKTSKALREWGRRWALELSMLEDVEVIREAFKARLEKLKYK